jgi:hypothetical protein
MQDPLDRLRPLLRVAGGIVVLLGAFLTWWGINLLSDHDVQPGTGRVVLVFGGVALLAGALIMRTGRR